MCQKGTFMFAASSSFKASHGLVYDRGLHLRGTGLWFDAQTQRRSCVLTEVLRTRPLGHQSVVASESIAQLLENMNYRGVVLPAPWHRWVRFAGIDVQMVDVDSCFSAAVLVRYEGVEMLVSGALAQHHTALPAAKQWVLSAPALDHCGYPWPFVVGQLLDFFAAAMRDGKSVGVWVDSLEVAYEALIRLEAEGVALRPVGMLSPWLKQTAGTTPAAVLVVKGSGRVRPERCVWLDSGLGSAPTELHTCTEVTTIPLQHYLAVKDLQRSISAGSFKRLVLVGVSSSLHQKVRCALAPQLDVTFLGGEAQLSLH